MEKFLISVIGILVVIDVIFIWCSCRVASWADENSRNLEKKIDK